MGVPEAILDVPEAILCKNENKANSAQLGGAGAWAELGNYSTNKIYTSNCKNNKDKLGLSCAKVRSNLTSQPNGVS